MSILLKFADATDCVFAGATVRRHDSEMHRNNIFTRILRGEIACKKVCEDAHVLAFHDFSEEASSEEIAALACAVGNIARDQGVADSGYRILSNTGVAAHREVPHFRLHLFGGRDLGGMLPRC